MTESGLIVQSHEIDIAASVDEVYDHIVRADRWPYVFSPTIHTEQVDLGGGEELLCLWAFANGEVRSWRSHRRLDPARSRVRFAQEVPAPPLTEMCGEWLITPRSDGGSHVELLHSYRVAGDDRRVEWVTRATDRNSVAELAALRDAVEQGAGFAESVVSFTDTVTVDADPAAVYDFLHRADRWPGRVPHVARLGLTQVDAATQVIEMDTRAANGSVHTTRSVRICFPEFGTIVYKQTEPPAVLSAHVGRWTVRASGTGTEVAAKHTAVIRPEKITEVLGDVGLDEARQKVREYLGANSLATLACAKAATERPAA